MANEWRVLEVTAQQEVEPRMLTSGTPSLWEHYQAYKLTWFKKNKISVVPRK
jgi:hypothetical protein